MEEEQTSAKYSMEKVHITLHHMIKMGYVYVHIRQLQQCNTGKGVG
jgi:hypothetical protein